MDKADKLHIASGLALATLGILFLIYEMLVWVSIVLVSILSIYILLILIQCALRAKHGKNEDRIFSLPNRTWAILLIGFFIITNVSAFANIYVKSEGIIDQTVEGKPIMTSKIDAVYFSSVTLTTLGYGDFIPNNKGRKYVVFHLGSGLLILFLIVPVVASRVSTW